MTDMHETFLERLDYLHMHATALRIDPDATRAQRRDADQMLDRIGHLTDAITTHKAAQ